jgi:hypothetical protein
MRFYPILEVAVALMCAVVISAIACCVSLALGPLAVVVVMVQMLVGGVIGVGCLLLRSPFAWACFGAPLSGLLGFAAIFARADPIPPMTFNLFIIGSMGFVLVFASFLMKFRRDRRERSKRVEAVTKGAGIDA